MTKDNSTVESLKDSIRASIVQPTDAEAKLNKVRGTIYLLKGVLEQIELEAEIGVEFSIMTVDFRTGKIDVDKSFRPKEPLQRIVIDPGRIGVDVGKMAEEE